MMLLITDDDDDDDDGDDYSDDDDSDNNHNGFRDNRNVIAVVDLDHNFLFIFMMILNRLFLVH